MGKKMIRFILNTIPRKYLIRFSYIFVQVSRFLLKGNKVECPVCGGKFRKFLPYGYQTVRENALCPKCLSLERHRLLWLFLQNKTGFFRDKLNVLHIAPEQSFYKRFKLLDNLKYYTADLESPLAEYKCDIQNMPFDNELFDIVLCNHVLEHVDNDKKALKEIHRVLRNGGFAILLSPVNFKRDTTFEDPSITDPKERTKIFGQYDHVRVYGNDYPERIQECGFRIEGENYLDTLDEKVKDRFKLPRLEFMYAYFK